MYCDIECITFKLGVFIWVHYLLAIHATLVPLLLKQNFYIQKKMQSITRELEPKCMVNVSSYLFIITKQSL